MEEITERVCEERSENIEMSSSEEDRIEQEYLTEEQYNLQDNIKRYDEQKKREREEDSSGSWTFVQSKEKKNKTDREQKNKSYAIEETFQVYISSNDEMPKQFALAKLFQKETIAADIEKIRYINPFKIRLDMTNERSVKQLESSRMLIEKGWRIQPAMEVNLTYGVIKDIDIDLTDEEIFNSISCPDPARLVSVNRLTRRKSDGSGWVPSESIRLCFKGSFRPLCVTVNDLKILVQPYVFPVSQCSRCWKFGHPTKRCPTVKVVCPKCSENHANCATMNYKCPNCGGQHMAFLRRCPTYIKERTIRQIMSDYNCTYRRALTIYVPPTYEVIPSTKQKKTFNFEPHRKPDNFPPIIPTKTSPKTPSFTEIITQAIVHTEPKQKSSYRPSKLQQHPKEEELFVFGNNITNNSNSSDQNNTTKHENQEREVNFSELLSRLKEIIFRNDETISMKVHNVIKCCVQWVILVVVENISDWPILKPILDLLGP